MNIQEITSFLSICKYGSFCKAAENLYMTQPTVSWHITSLEKELGHRLFLRKRGQKGLTLTEKGELFYPQAVKWEALWNETMDLLNRKAYSEYHFACTPSFSDKLVPFFHTYFQDTLPECNIVLSTRTSDVIFSGIESKAYDCGITAITMPSERVRSRQIASEKLVFVCRKESSFTSPVRVSGLSVSDFIFSNWTLEFANWRKARFFGKPFAQLSSFGNIGSFFIRSDNWSILPYSLFRNLGDAFRSCILDETPPDRPIYFINAIPEKTEFTDVALEALYKYFSLYQDGLTLM